MYNDLVSFNPDAQLISERLGQPVVYIPPGPFLMGSSPDDDPDAVSRACRFELPQHLVTIDGYYIGRFPVTNAAFRCFMDAGGYQKQEYWAEHEWKTKETAFADYSNPQKVIPSWQRPACWDRPGWTGPDQPVAGVHLYEALAYCRWLSQVSGLSIRLPTEAEWEKAARGGDGRLFPWGNNPPRNDLCTFNLDFNNSHPSVVGLHSPQGDSPYGCADMVGNVCEWTCSKFSPYPYLTDGSWEGPSHTKVRRGGCYASRQRWVRCASRQGHDVVMRELSGRVVRFREMGFRIALVGDGDHA